MRSNLMSSPDELEQELRKLGPVTGGDVLVFHGFGDLAEEITEGVFAYYTEIARSHLTDDETVLACRYLPLIVFTDGDATIEHLNEDDMRHHGWTRI